MAGQTFTAPSGILSEDGQRTITSTSVFIGEVKADAVTCVRPRSGEGPAWSPFIGNDKKVDEPALMAVKQEAASGEALCGVSPFYFYG